MKKQKGKADLGLVGSLIVIAIVIAGLIGWIMNIVAVADTCCTPLNGMLVLRIVGIFVVPLGAVLGFF